MRILKIAGRNLASLAADFCVDFTQEPLASAGLFAISGPTGAGKSTLLDAMCLALYDATPRLLKRKGTSLLPDVGTDTVSVQDPRTLLRRGASEGWSEVDFVGNDGLSYRARWSIKRSYGRASGALQKTRMSLHRLPEMIALGGTNTEAMQEIEQRIGLSFEQFTRAVLLAQNEFSAFLKTEENERGELLETLTGSVIYSEISKRAFERFRTEQNRMRELSARLADQAPLEPEARAALDAEAAAADAVLQQLDERRALLERQLRWQQESEKLQQQVQAAETALAAGVAAVEAAAQRKRRLATIDAVQPARQLVADSARILAETGAVEASIAACAEALEQAAAQQEQAALAHAAAGAQLQAAEAAQRAAAPLLDQAKALDATIAALAQTHLGAAKARDSSALGLAGATAAASELAHKLAAARSAHEQETAWLDSHRQHEPLAAQWPHWDRLFAQAERESAREHALAAELAQAQAALTRTAAGEQAAAAALQESLARLRGLEASRQQAIAAVAAFDADKLHAERQSLNQRRDSLVAAEKAWHELEATRDRVRNAGARAQDIRAAIAAANATLAAAASEAAGIEAARTQAERSCEAAKLACGASVTKLRSTLEDGLPCPVCGSEEHPYQHQDETLQAMLASLEAEVERCRALAAHNLSVQSTQRAVIAANEQQLAAAMREQAVLAEALERLEPAWAAHPLAAQAPAEAGRVAWFAAQQQQLRESAQQLDAREQALRAAAQEREQAQAACDRGAAERDCLGEAAAQARNAAAQAGASHAALAERRAQAASNAAAVLGELDDAFADGRAWRGEWRDDAARFRAQCASFAAQWASHTQQQAALAASVAAMEIEQGALQKRCEHAEELAAQARAAFAQADTELQARQRERAALWDGRPVQEVEAGFAAALDGARLQLASQQAAREKAAHAETRARESLAHNTRRLAALQSDKKAAAARLDAWIAGFGARHPGLEAVDGAALAALLDLDPAWIEQERRALSGLDAGAASAAAVLAERRERHALHHQGAPADDACPPAELPASLAALLDQRKLAHDAATALRLQLAQDNVRRENSQAVTAEIEAQRAVERRWGQMNELIGSADGKKFRNYAQQFTLDVLLGYANSHLAHLARRYRLERVATSGGPSLGLLVRDQDMGGEIRSVNSLSGGESFLVSLALALGLASLSSNRVRVESLFIDEGFGSLDSDTLRVAMDALDGLQSMGRKVGVISHVQEMTERIATKILVQPAGGGTSSVTVQ